MVLHVIRKRELMDRGRFILTEFPGWIRDTHIVYDRILFAARFGMEKDRKDFAVESFGQKFGWYNFAWEEKFSVRSLGLFFREIFIGGLDGEGHGPPL